MEFPVDPTVAITSPCFTCCPLDTFNVEQCPYNVCTPFPCDITTWFPYPWLYPYDANTTVQDATAFIGVPFGAPISNPVCAPDLILLETPNLDVIVPEIGCINEIPSGTVVLDNFIDWRIICSATI